MRQSIVDVARDSAAEPVGVEDERCQAGAETQVGWEHTGEGVVPHVEGLQARETAGASVAEPEQRIRGGELLVIEVLNQ